MFFFDKMKNLFKENGKNVKFYALIFLVIVLLYFAVSPFPSFQVVKNVSTKCVSFPNNPVTAVWT